MLCLSLVPQKLTTASAPTSSGEDSPPFSGEDKIYEKTGHAENAYKETETPPEQLNSNLSARYVDDAIASLTEFTLTH